MEEQCKNLKLKDWYIKMYPNDELGFELNPTATFYDLFIALDSYKDVYELFQISDSVIRERLFEKLAKLIQVDYDYIYEQWLKCN